MLGLNRSGTSALTKALAACGVALDFEHSALPLGLFKPDSGRSVAFKGVLLLHQRVGRGVLSLPDRTGPVTLDPPPVP